MAKNVDNNSQGDKNNNPNNYYYNLKTKLNVDDNAKVTNRWEGFKLNRTLNNIHQNCVCVSGHN